MSFFSRAILSAFCFVADLMRSVLIMTFAWGFSFEWIVGNNIYYVVSRFVVIIVAMWIYGSKKVDGML